MGQVRRLVRQHGSTVVTIPREVIRLWGEPRHQGQVEVILRQVPGVPDHVELEVRWVHPPAPEDPHG